MLNHEPVFFSKDNGLENPDPAVYGGKGAGLLRMAHLGLNVPAGVVLPTHWDKEGVKNPLGITDVLLRLASNEDDLSRIYSVRSGAPVSMPGMMDTILNIGVTDATIAHLIVRHGARFAWDCYCRLIMTLAPSAFNVAASNYNAYEPGLSATDLRLLVQRWLKEFLEITGRHFPTTLYQQTCAAVKAVYASWHSERAVLYRKLHSIPDSIGTACVIQRMVFGNAGDDSGTGVLFSRDPSTGRKCILGEYLTNAQGEDVVSGVRTPRPLARMAYASGEWPALHAELYSIAGRLEALYQDMVDIEFTVERGKLFILQVRAGKRSAPAAFKIAADMLRDGTINETVAAERITAKQLRFIQQPIVDPCFEVKATLEGLAGCPGVVKGYVCFNGDDIDAVLSAGRLPIIVRDETTPNDIALMNEAAAVLTARGGVTCHAAVVARSMDKPCVVGCEGCLDLEHGSTITLDGASGRVWLGHDVPVLDGADNPDVRFVLDEFFESAGYARQVTVPTEARHVHQRICASRWWGDTELLKAVLAAVAKQPAAYTLDLTPPDQGEANHYRTMFGLDPSEDWSVEAVAILSEAAVSGLTIVGVAALKAIEMLRKAGYRVPNTGNATTVGDFLNGDVIDDVFIDRVLGGAHVLEALKPLAKPIVRVKDAAPPEYVAFKVLSGEIAV